MCFLFELPLFFSLVLSFLFCESCIVIAFSPLVKFSFTLFSYLFNDYHRIYNTYLWGLLSCEKMNTFFFSPPIIGTIKQFIIHVPHYCLLFYCLCILIPCMYETPQENSIIIFCLPYTHSHMLSSSPALYSFFLFLISS